MSEQINEDSTAKKFAKKGLWGIVIAILVGSVMIILQMFGIIGAPVKASNAEVQQITKETQQVQTNYSEKTTVSAITKTNVPTVKTSVAKPIKAKKATKKTK